MYNIKQYEKGEKMDKETEKKALQALERQKKQYKRQNAYIENTFDRVSVTLPKGTKERIKAAGVGSVNGYINKLVADDLARRGIIGNTKKEE